VAVSAYVVGELMQGGHSSRLRVVRRVNAKKISQHRRHTRTAADSCFVLTYYLIFRIFLRSPYVHTRSCSAELVHPSFLSATVAFNRNCLYKHQVRLAPVYRTCWRDEQLARLDIAISTIDAGQPLSHDLHPMGCGQHDPRVAR
jgi:hypothetical protein